MKICEATDADRDAIWNIFHDVVAPGDTYAFDPGISREDALEYWFRLGTHTYVAKLDGLKPSSYSQRRALLVLIFCGLTSLAAVRTLRTQRSWSRQMRVVRGSVAGWPSIV
jgi:hypothetical protein